MCYNQSYRRRWWKKNRIPNIWQYVCLVQAINIRSVVYWLFWLFDCGYFSFYSFRIAWLYTSYVIPIDGRCQFPENRPNFTPKMLSFPLELLETPEFYLTKHFRVLRTSCIIHSDMKNGNMQQKKPFDFSVWDVCTYKMRHFTRELEYLAGISVVSLVQPKKRIGSAFFPLREESRGDVEGNWDKIKEEQQSPILKRIWQWNIAA